MPSRTSTSDTQAKRYSKKTRQNKVTYEGGEDKHQKKKEGKEKKTRRKRRKV